MKEATGELNVTVIVVISVGVLATFFFTILWPMIKGNFSKEADCSRAVCNCGNSKKDVYGVSLSPAKEEKGIKYCNCAVKGIKESITCVYKG